MGRFRKNKYGVAPVDERTYHGVVYHSKAEMSQAQLLDFLKQQGNIAWWLRQVPVLLRDNDGTAIKAVIDFLVCEIQPDHLTKHTYGIEVKGAHTAKWRRCRKLWQKTGPFPLHVKSAKGLETEEILVSPPDERAA